jgi:hypothetical protein
MATLKELILDASTSRRSIDPVYENNLRDETVKRIHHYTSLGVVNDSDFADAEDALVVYKSAGDVIEHVSVAPIKDPSVASLPFAERRQYMRIRKLEPTGEVKEVQDEDTTKVTALVTNYGTLEDFQTSFANPTDYGIELQTYFDGMYLDLKDEVLGEFQTAFEAAHPNS